MRSLAAVRRPILCRRLSAVCCLLVTGLSGCATIVHGTKQVVPIVSDPPGADVTVDGQPVGKTPFRAALSRSRSHLVTVSLDSAPPVNIELTRRLSGWVIGNIFLDAFPVVIDFMTGAAYAFNLDTVKVGFAGMGPESELRRAGLAPTDRIRFRTAQSDTGFVFARVDSLVAGQLHMRQSFRAASRNYESPLSVPLADLRQVDFAVSGFGRQHGWTAVHHVNVITWGLPVIVGSAMAIPAAGLAVGGYYSLLAAPIAYGLGSAGASRWAPLEARRAGSPLLVDDRLRVWQVGSERRVSGRLITVDSLDIHIRDGGGITRVQRSMISSMQLHNGYDLRRGAQRGLAIGALIGAITGAELNGSITQPNGQDLMLGAGAGAIVGLFGTAALAPRRWVEVRKW